MTPFRPTSALCLRKLHLWRRGYPNFVVCVDCGRTERLYERFMLLLR